MLRPDVRRVLFLQAVLTALCLTVEVFCRVVLHLKNPFDRPILTDWFPDFVRQEPRFAGLHTAAFFSLQRYHMMYPAPAVFFYGPFMLVPASFRTEFYVVVLVGTFVGAAVLLGKGLVLRGMSRAGAGQAIGLGVVLSYPLWFATDRGNIEMFLWAVVAVGVWSFVRGRESLAAVCFGVAASVKIYPVVYLGLFVSRRRWRPVVVGLLTVALVTVAALWVVYPNLGRSLRETRVGLQQFDEVFVRHVRPVEIGFDHSLFALYKRLFDPTPERLARVAPVYVALAVLAGVGLFVGRIIRLPLPNQVLLLSVATILLPPVSYDYTLLHLYTPLGMFLTVTVPLHRTPHGRVVLTLFGMLLAPWTEFILRGERLEGQIKAVLLLTLFVVGLVWRLEEDGMGRRGAPGEPETRATVD